jgi:uncharacterized surface protein with fasciclin (FAS1) repeats
MKKLLNTLIFSLAAASLSSLAPALDDAVFSFGDGSYTNWFGTFTPESSPLADEGWIQHQEHGRLYIIAEGEGIWLYDDNINALGETIHGWAYTNRNWFPYFYVQPEIYLYYVAGISGPADSPRVFLDLTAGSQILLPKVTTQTVVDIAIATEAFSSLVAAVVQAELVDALSSEGPFTVFAPTNTAFDNAAAAILGDGNTAGDLLAALDKDTLTGILTYHVVPAKVLSGNIGLDLGSILRGEYISGYVTTLNGADVQVDVTPFGVMLDGTSMVTWPDIEASNGVIHVIDSVLLPPKDIVGVAVDAGFSSLAAAATKADLLDALMGPGPLTVFAPTNEAFDNAAAAILGEGKTGPDLVAALEPAALADILLYHVYDDKVYSAEVAPGDITMLNGDPATLVIGPSGKIRINEARIDPADIKASNGVIHVIDAVILPPAE